jgi:poly(hydroxyalkanoate) depolymerase family esterase
MKLNHKLFENMRIATRSLLGQGPVAATAAIQKVLQGQARGPGSGPGPGAGGGFMSRIGCTFAAARPAPQASKAAPPPPQQQPSAAPPAATEFLSRLMPDLMATLERAGDAGRAGFKMPNFEMPAFDLGAMGGGMGSASAPADALPGKFIDGSHTNPAGTRSYKLYVPSTYTGAQAVPLVVMLHGCTQNPVDFASGTQMNQLAEEMQCLVVYPAQSQQANAQRCWNWFSAVDQTRDQGEPSIIAGITRDVMASHKVDDSQVYVAGLSAGGAMATIMGTLYPDLYAAVGVHSGLPFASAHDLPSALAAMKGKFGRPREQGESIPIIVFHGDRDTTVHPAAGDELIARGKHQGAREIVIEPGRVPDGHAYTRTVHKHPDGTPHAEQWLIHGAGHAWSGGSANGSYTDGKGPDASREMMRFFRTKR